MPTKTTGLVRPTFGDNPLQAFHWTPQPEAERLVAEVISDFLGRHSTAREFARRLHAEAGVRFSDVVAEIEAEDKLVPPRRLKSCGWQEDRAGVFRHPGGIFPTFGTSDRVGYSVGTKVDDVVDFLATQDLPFDRVVGEAGAPYRWAYVDGDSWYVHERHGSRTFAHDGVVAAELREVVQVKEQFRLRRRRWPSEEVAFDEAGRSIEWAISRVGQDFACDVFFAAEREYWQRRNRAAQVQKARQDRLGLGWANHDHHTYRSSRRHFARLVSVFEKLGFHCRERFYAGREAGWGAQVLEQPNAGVVVFADVDLSPDEVLVDFAHEPLPEREKLGTVGLWCALHGESFLEAGMHHLECQFDFEALRGQLEAEAGIRTMKPFTDFPYLRQAFTEGERWPVREERVAALLARGQITPDQAAAFRRDGAIGSHLENLERNQGFKGFNQRGVSEIIAATDPRRHVT